MRVICGICDAGAACQRASRKTIPDRRRGLQPVGRRRNPRKLVYTGACGTQYTARWEEWSTVRLLRLTHQLAAGEHAVELALEADGDPQPSTARFDFQLPPQDREDLRWYLEDYLQYPVDPAPEIAAGVEARLAIIGENLFTAIFQANERSDAIASPRRSSRCS
jgi:hypothetical protein